MSMTIECRDACTTGPMSSLRQRQGASLPHVYVYAPARMVRAWDVCGLLGWAGLACLLACLLCVHQQLGTASTAALPCPAGGQLACDLI